MSTFVIVHGAWGGGWEWSDVATRLRARGHDAFTPTLTGLGERSHLCLDQRVGLATHVEDIVAAVEFERLEGVVLCAASYGGMPVTVAAERLGDRVRRIVYIDALVPLSGQCALDLLPPMFRTAVRSGLDAHGAGWRVPMPDDLIDALLPPGSIPAAARRDYLARLRDHPAASFAGASDLGGV
jgi:pimeloyl-ACP methyl ester carboxylesterase